MTFVAFAAAVIFGVMLAETRLSMRQEAALRAAGAVEPPGDPYRAMALIYPGAFLAMAIEGLWRAAARPETNSGGPAWALSGVILFVAAKAIKYWAMATLRDRWSFRVLIQPDRPLVASGPYRYVAHPNYVGVMGELVGAAMMMRAPWAGAIGVAAFGLVLTRRVRVESRALAACRQAAGRAGPSEQQRSIS